MRNFTLISSSFFLFSSSGPIIGHDATFYKLFHMFNLVYLDLQLSVYTFLLMSV